MNPASGNNEFVQLIENNKAIIYKVCNLYCRDPHKRDDLAQDIVYNLWKSYQSFNSAFRFTTWMYRIALNVAISFYRNESKSGKSQHYTGGFPVFQTITEEPSDNEDNIRLLLNFINQLKEIDRTIILLYLDEKPYTEISEITGISITNVSTRVNRIKEKLKNNFKNLSNNHYGTR
jgi:RNA polymerase sigma-70 factor, ECF subfamily